MRCLSGALCSGARTFRSHPGFTLAPFSGLEPEVLALGASRPRVARQFPTEAPMLGVGGSVAGVFLANWACRGVMWSISGPGVGYIELVLDARVLTFTADRTGGL